MTSTKKYCCARIFVIFGIILLGLTFSLSLLTYTYPCWVTYIPKHVMMREQWEYYPRYRGIFEECIRSKLEKDPIVFNKYKINSQVCIIIDIGQYKDFEQDNNYKLIIRLRQSQIGIHGVAILFSFIGLILIISQLWKWFFNFTESTYFIKWRNGMGILSILIFLLLATSCSISTALFLFIENNPKYSTKLLPYSEFSIKEIKREYGPMFYIGWITTGVSLLTGISFFISGYIGEKIEKEQYKSDIYSIENPIFTEEYTKNEKLFLTPVYSTISHYPASTSIPTANDIFSPNPLPRSKL